MTMPEVLERKRAAVLERWFQAVAATYPEEAARFMGRGGDPFANPVGNALRTGLARVYDGLREGRPVEELAPAVDGMVRIRAVQEFAPSAAVGFLFALKGILREELADAGVGAAERAALDDRVDRVALLAFDVYMQCRETLFQIRVREIKDFQLIAGYAGGCAPAACGGSHPTAKEGR